jgi:hypothetical protein
MRWIVYAAVENNLLPVESCQLFAAEVPRLPLSTHMWLHRADDQM